MIEFVTKRDGSKEKFDPSKLSKWAEWASVVGVDWFQIVGDAYKKCSDGVTTDELHKALISSCIDLETTPALLMAGRLMIGELYKSVFGGVDNIPTLKDFYRTMVEQGYWEDMNYSEEELDFLNTIIKHENDFELSSTQVLQDVQKYLISDVTTKKVKETPQFALMRQAMGAHKDQPKDRRVSDVVGMYGDLKCSVNTPTPNKTNLGTYKRAYASCCASMATDELDSIEAMNHVVWTMTAASAGQGTYLQTRSLGDGIRGGTIKHGGKLPYMRLMEKETAANMQGSRGGAVKTELNCLDPEIFTLLKLRNPTTTANNRIDGMDYAFKCNDSFIERAKKGKDWLLISYAEAPDLWKHFYDVDLTEFEHLLESYMQRGKGRIVKARDVLKEHIQQDEVVGRQYETFVTSLNAHTPFKDVIHQSNLCQELAEPTKPYRSVLELYKQDESVQGEVAMCNLAAIPVGKVSLNPKKYEELAYRTLLMVDNTIDIAELPLPHVDYTAKNRRSVMIGITDLAHAMASGGYSYTDVHGKNFIHRVAELHMFSMLKASMRLAKEKGACGWFHKTKYSDGWLPIDTYNKNVDNVHTQKLLCDWEGLREDIKKYGLRNSALVGHMPCESSSVRGNDTNGLYPIREGVVVKKSGNTKVVFIPPEWESLQGFYEQAWSIPHNDMVDCYAIIQKFTDQAISADIYHKFGKAKKVGLKQLMEEFFYRHKMGLKTRYYKHFATGASIIEQEESCVGGGCKL